jgi:hypothetical protein
MVQVVNNVFYLDVKKENGNVTSFAKSSLKKVHLANEAVFLNMLDEIPYFLDYKFTEDPATPGLPYTSSQQLYADILMYLVT